MIEQIDLKYELSELDVGCSGACDLMSAIYVLSVFCFFMFLLCFSCILCFFIFVFWGFMFFILLFALVDRYLHAVKKNPGALSPRRQIILPT